MSTTILTSFSVNDTISTGKRIGEILMPGDAVALIGELGAGKTYLTKGIAIGLGIQEARDIVSPSFTIVNEYIFKPAGEKHERKIPIYHMDFYRMNSPEEVDGIGVFEYFSNKDAIKIIEWADKFPQFLPDEYIRITIKILDDNMREIKLEANGRNYLTRLKRLKAREKDVTTLMSGRLPGRISSSLKDIGAVAEELGYTAYVVGGFVRDLLLKKENFDIDIVVEGDGIKLAKEFAERFDATCKSHKRFGTSTVFLSDGFRIDFATARTEYYKSPAALPVVRQSLIRKDLMRRDFTINALAIRLGSKRHNMLVDYFGGEKDIKEKTIRVLHSQSFVDDPTRVFRAVRFEQRLGFRIEKDTEKLIEDAAEKKLFHKLSGKRLFAELILILREPHCYRAVKRMNKSGLLRFFHEKFDFSKSQEDLMKRIEERIKWSQSIKIEEEYQDWLVCLAALVIKLDQNDLKQFCDRLAVPHRFRIKFKDLRERYQNILLKLKKKKEIKPSCIVNILKDLSIEGIVFLTAFTNDNRTRNHLENYLTNFRKIRREINGNELKKLGIKPGPLFGKILDEIYEARIDKVINSKEGEIELAKKLAERFQKKV